MPNLTESLVESYYKAFSIQDNITETELDANGNPIAVSLSSKSQLEASLAEQLVVELEDGVLTNNLGVPVIIACTKVKTYDSLVWFFFSFSLLLN